MAVDQEPNIWDSTSLQPLLSKVTVSVSHHWAYKVTIAPLTHVKFNNSSHGWYHIQFQFTSEFHQMNEYHIAENQLSGAE